jgi:amino-acid N-acetyltransferase
VSAPFAKLLRGAAPYINAHRGRTFVLALGGDAIEHASFTTTVHDLALLTSLGIRLIVVFGAREQINRALARDGLAPRYQRYLRVTDEVAIGIVRASIAATQVQIEAQLSTALPGTPMQNARLRVVSGNWVSAAPVGVLDGVDLGYTGRIRGIDAAGIRAQLDAGNLPLLAPLGFSPSGETFAINADDLAGAVATAVGADKLIVLSAQPGAVDEAGDLLTELTPGELHALIDRLPENDWTRVRLSALLRAARGGVRRCHIVSFADDGALLTELFTREGAGSQVTDERYETIRTATPEDVPGIVELIRPLEARGILVRRPRDLLEREHERYVVAEIDRLIIGCAALYPHADTGAGELACLAVHADYRERKPFESHDPDDPRTVGEVLLGEVEKRARASGMRRLYALTTHTADWFREHGFVLATPADLPPPKQALYNQQRNSKVLVKEL